MRKVLILGLLLLNSQLIFAQNEVGPEGGKLLWILLILAVIVFALLFIIGKKVIKWNGPLIPRKKLAIELEKDALYYPDNLKLSVKNTGNTDVDLDQPLLVFDNFWIKRKFKLKGMENRTFYPLFFEKGKSHTLQIDLSRFYGHDKSLKKFPKVTVYLFDVKGKKLGSKSTYMRKTLFKF